MTPVNMAKHRNNPNMPFWRMIKEGYDHFEVSHQEPKVDFCEKKYVFDAVKPPDAKRDPVFNASAKCPAYVIPDELADAVREKEHQDDAQYAKLVARGTPVARLNTGIDGGMNKVFAARVPEGSTGLSEGGDSSTLSMLAMSRAPGTIPIDHVNPPKPNLAPTDESASSTSVPTGSTSATRVASASPGQSEGLFSSLARKMGIGGTADTPAATAQPAPAPAKPKTAETKHHDAGPRVEKLAAAPKAVENKAAEKTTETRQAAARPPVKPAATDNAQAAAQPAQPAAKDTVLAGAQPIVSSNSFESRFSGLK